MSLIICIFAENIMNMKTHYLMPGYVFESSWEVCNKVGGIYTVLSTRAKTLHDKLADHLFFIGPDVWKDKINPLFIEDKNLKELHELIF